MLDAAAKRRTTIGEKNPRAKITDADVIEIRQRWSLNPTTEERRRLEHEFGFSKSGLGAILLGVNWKHLL
jgi:hypothetical protein